MIITMTFDMTTEEDRFEHEIHASAKLMHHALSDFRSYLGAKVKYLEPDMRPSADEIYAEFCEIVAGIPVDL